MYRWDLNVAGVLDVGDTISQAQSVFTPLQHVRAAEQEERLHVLCGVRVRVCMQCVCVYVYRLGSARGADESECWKNQRAAAAIQIHVCPCAPWL